MINTYHTSLPPPPPPPVPPRYHSRPEPRPYSSLIWFLAVVLVIHMFLTFGGFIYLFDKGSQAGHLQEECDEKYHSDFLIMKRIQECDDNTLDDQSLLSCKQLVNKFQNVLAKASQTEGRAAMLTGEQYHGALAHMSVKGSSSKTCPAKSNEICALEWNSDHSSKVKVDTRGDSRLRIVHPGYYYVYSQVTFSASANVPLENIIRHVKEKKQTDRYRQPETKDEILLRSYCASHHPRQPLCTASQGGVFKLEQGEELYVQVTNLTWVNYDWNATFFGLYKL